MKQVLFVLGLIFVLGLGAVCAQDQGSSSQNRVGADVQLNAVIAKAKDLSPLATASKKATIGKGKATATTANTEGDDDSFWVESIDSNGDNRRIVAAGERVTVLWFDV